MKNKKLSKIVNIKIGLPSLVILAIAAIVLFSIIAHNSKPKNHIEIATTSILEAFEYSSELSTFESVYNGIAELKNEKDPEKIDGYVSYSAIVKAGFDLKDAQIDAKDKVITITFPKIKITSSDVVEDFEFIFENDKANTDKNILKRSSDACKEDIEQELKNETAILELAEDNAINVLTALASPIIDSLGQKYSLVVKMED